MVIERDDDGVYLLWLEFCFSDRPPTLKRLSAAMKGSKALRGLSFGRFPPCLTQVYSWACVLNCMDDRSLSSWEILDWNGCVAVMQPLQLLTWVAGVFWKRQAIWVRWDPSCLLNVVVFILETCGRISTSKEGFTSLKLHSSWWVCWICFRNAGPQSQLVPERWAAVTDLVAMSAGFTSVSTYCHCSGEEKLLIRRTRLLT